MPADERVTRSSFHDLTPLSAPRPMPVLPTRKWTDDQWERIQRGYQSGDMDEKWDVFTEDNVVFLHRSWTGFEIFEAAFVPAEGGGWTIAGAMVESDPERYGGSSAMRSALMLELVLSAIVLGEDATELRTRLVELATPTSSNTDALPGVVLHSHIGLRSGT
ncbi:hypothetical protein [Streptomyces sp. WM6368]|uniref:hypothetical protein n=1 Tax=Streptomyces sp. WM6368 TaxID=1415554 RepID=UPI001F4055A8|nr:hypothetical protein [Streptomyces sp. WM6368]